MAWLDAEGTLNTNLMAVVLPMAHAEATHVEAVAPGCESEGNIEYWFCEACGQAWLDAECTLNTNLKAVILPATHTAVVHIDAVAPGCHMTGNIEYWYCANCEIFWADEAQTQVIAYLSTVIPALGGEVVHVEAVDATCTENGNIEHWYCEECELVWADEALTQITNHKNVIIGAAHTYTDESDLQCDVCGDIAEGEYKVMTFGGNSISESDEKGTGLAFKFNTNAFGIQTTLGSNEAIYDDAVVIVDGESFELIGMGALVSLKSDMSGALDIPAVYLYNREEYSTSFAVRITNIPESQWDAWIYARPYFTFANAEGVEETIYGDVQFESVNGYQN